MTTQHRMKKAFELFCAALRAGATPDELVDVVREHAPIVATRHRVHMAETGEVPAPPDLNAAIRRNVQVVDDEPESRNTGEVPNPPSLNASVRAFVKRIVR